MEPQKTIRKLIEASIDDERMLKHEIRSVVGHRREVFEQLAVERSASVEKLREIALRNGDTSAHHGSWAEALRELGNSIRVALAGSPSNSDSVGSCRSSCKRTEARFEKALHHPWPPGVYAELAEQRAQLERAGETLLLLQYGIKPAERTVEGAPPPSANTH